MDTSQLLKDIQEMKSSLSFPQYTKFSQNIDKVMKANTTTTLTTDALKVSNLEDLGEKVWKIAEIVCKFRVPTSKDTYYMAERVTESEISYYSITVFQNGKEKRKLRRLTGENAIDFHTRLHVTYVITRPYEAKAWLLKWGGRALFSGKNLEDLIEQYE